MEGNNNKKNTIAIVGFVLSFFTTIIGLVLSIIGLSKSKELNDGKGFSIAGIIISSIRLALAILVILFAFIFTGTSFKIYNSPEFRSTIEEIVNTAKNETTTGTIEKIIDEHLEEETTYEFKELQFINSDCSTEYFSCQYSCFGQAKDNNCEFYTYTIDSNYEFKRSDSDKTYYSKNSIINISESTSDYSDYFIIYDLKGNKLASKEGTTYLVNGIDTTYFHTTIRNNNIYYVTCEHYNGMCQLNKMNTGTLKNDKVTEFSAVQGE